MGRSVAVVALVCVASACTGGGEATPTTTTATTVAVVLDSVPPITDLPARDPADVRRAERALIAVEDLPSGWSLTPNTDHRTRVDLAGCAPAAISMAVAAGDDLVAPDGTLVSQSVAVGDPVVVGDVMDDLRDPRAATCIGDAARRVVETQIAAVPGTPRDVAIGDQTVTTGRLAPSGDGSVAFEVAFPVEIDGLQADTFVDVVVVRVGESVAVLTARRAAGPPDRSALEEMSAVVARRLADTTEQ